jgi:hypothetical protein
MELRLPLPLALKNISHIGAQLDRRRNHDDVVARPDQRALISCAPQKASP